jgi:DtxR family Mn-dependent transcriptional regulator
MVAVGEFNLAVEQYLETIYELEESGIPPMRARLVERLGVSAPAVSETVQRLEREGYLTLDRRRVMRLTESGRHYATAIMRRHRLAERLLVDVLHVPWHQVHEEAGRLEHAISENLERHLVQLLGDPATCPHGNPIPGSANAIDPGPLVPVSELPPEQPHVLERIDEEVEARPEIMLLLEQCRLMPGHQVLLRSVGTDRITVGSETGDTELPPDVAARLYVATTAPASAG